MICPNRNTQEWKDLVRELGNEVDAMYAFTVNGEEIPTIVKAKQILSKVKSNEDIRDLEYKHKLRNPNSGRLYVKSYEDAMAKSAELNQDLRGYKAEVTKVRFGEAPNYKEGYGVHIVETTTAIKEGVDFVFEQNPELANIGTRGQYSQYLNTIFPDSQVKDIVYHGGSKTFEQFIIDSENRASGTSQIKKGVYFSRSKNVAKDYVQSKEGITSNALNIILNNVEKSLGLREYDVYGSKEDGYTYEEEEYKKPSEVISKLEKLYGKLTKNNLYFFSEEGLSDYSYMNQLKDFENLNIDSLIDAMRTDDIKKIKSIISEYNTTNKDTSKLYSVVVNLKNPTIISNKETVPIYNSLIGKESLINKAESIIVENVYDSVEGNMGEPSDTIIVFEPEQIHILGSKQDLQGFKEFIKGNYPEQGQIIETLESNLEELNKVEKNDTLEEAKQDILRDFEKYYPQYADLTIQEREIMIDMMSDGEINTYC